jgi:hypothetical protein
VDRVVSRADSDRRRADGARSRAFLEQARRGIRDWWELMEQRGTRTDMPMKPQVVAWHLSQALDDDAISRTCIVRQAFPARRAATAGLSAHDPPGAMAR